MNNHQTMIFNGIEYNATKQSQFVNRLNEYARLGLVASPNRQLTNTMACKLLAGSNHRTQFITEKR